MIKQQMMSPANALHHWAVDGMSVAQVLSHTGFSTIGELYVEYTDALEKREMAEQDMYMSPDERQREEDTEEVWEQCGDYLREMVPPHEYDAEIERLIPLIRAKRQYHQAAASQPFRDAVKRRKALQ
ncbi:hypothetical protein U8C31_18320 [Sinorhizobium medicae]|uniref:hypothetical protein n=1 Tax=Sinorhizobium medicae TaxID=110321 RepID=UPI002AF6AE96|nr:hypothetical protein [Sinorhizobium medicae]WQO72192.1 hypothetical protein U8C31_18320 [Sinorhizobium medicae]